MLYHFPKICLSKSNNSNDFSSLLKSALVELTEIKPPTYVKAVGRGEAAGKLGTFTLDLAVTLNDLGNDEVEVVYNTDANIVGKLATFGERIMRSKANSVVAQFVKNLQNKLEEKTK